MDEQGLRESLETYKEQLSQVEVALATSNHDNKDLIQLQTDIIQVIQLTEESLLSLRKSQILSSLEDVQPSESVQDTSDDTLIGSSLPTTSQDDQLEEDICGMRCSAPYSHAWGELDYHNALIYSVDPITHDIEPTVKVFFCHPTNEAMKMCPHFLDSKCWFSEGECRYSHGHSVNVSDLREYTDYDYSVLVEGSPCLAKYTDGLWYKAMIIGQHHDTVTIQYQSYHGHHDLDLGSVIPKGHQEVLSDEEDRHITDDKMSVVSDHAGPPEGDTNYTVSSTASVGEWEQYTKGIGSKLMRQMGYKAGEGLGKQSQGRAEPVPIKILPAGKSLDKIIQLQAKADVSGEKKASNRERHVKFHVFDFLNRKLGHKKADVSTLAHTPTKVVKQQSSKAPTTTGINVQLLKTQEEIKNVKRKLSKLDESLSRNAGRDKKVMDVIRSKVSSLTHYLKQLNSSLALMEKTQHSKKELKKLTVF